MFSRKPKPDFHLQITKGEIAGQRTCFLQEKFFSASTDLGKAEKEAFIVKVDPPFSPREIGQDRSVERVVLLPLHQKQKLSNYIDGNFRSMGVMVFGAQYFTPGADYENIDGLDYIAAGVIEKR